MGKKELFDRSIKDSFIAGMPILPGITVKGEEDFGRYITTRGITKWHDTYFTEVFEKTILRELSDKVIDRYENGKGSELNSKFYCVASSSRLAVASFSKKKNGEITKISSFRGEALTCFSFEKGLKINNVGGIPPQMDVWIKTKTQEYFYEVKCHEIFDSHNQILLSVSYNQNDVFKEIAATYGLPLDKEVVKDRHSYYSFDWSNFNLKCKTHHFDLKQFICHLMGIISNTSLEDKKQFVYLFYKNDSAEFSIIYEELEMEIKQIKESFQWLLDKYDINFSFEYNTKFDTLK